MERRCHHTLHVYSLKLLGEEDIKDEIKEKMKRSYEKLV
jgi:hypothetical protein